MTACACSPCPAATATCPSPCAGRAISDLIQERCERGRWKPMKEGTEFFYDDRMRMLTVPSGNRNMSIAVRWQGDFRSDPGALRTRALETHEGRDGILLR